MSGKLILCATPIGNLEDITLRALSALRRAKVIACEDTRRTRKLLTHHGISGGELVTYNDTNERKRAGELVTRMRAGDEVVLVSDAGMPGLSDPGYRLVRACVEEGLPVEVLPGATAVVSALVLSGLPSARFAFEGFLSRRAGDRRRRIEDLKEERRTMIFFESPHRIRACLADLAEILGDRRAVVARELTKLHEEVRRGSLEELLVSVEEHPPRGEIVVVVEGASGSISQADPEELAAAARALMEEGVDRKEALTRIARQARVSRRAVFDALVEASEKG